MFTVGEEPAAIRSISYHSDDTKLFKALCDCLTADEYEDLKASKLGVFIKFKELGFGWTSRLIHFILCFQLDTKKKFELWSLVVSQHVRFSLIEFEHLTGLNCDYIKDLENPRCEVTKEMTAFLEKMGVDLDTGPSIEQITKAFYRCDEWSRDDRKRLGYLAIYAGYIEGKKFSTATPASLERLVMDLEKFENYPWGRVAFKVLMDSLKAKDLTQTGYTVDGQTVSTVAGLQGWPRTTQMFLVGYQQTVTGTHKVVKIKVSPVKSESVVKEESSRPRKKARKGSSVSAEAPAAGSDGFGMKKEQIERAFKNISDAMSDGFGTCLREIKLLGDRMGAVEKKVGITKKGSSSDDLQLTKPVHEPEVSTKTSPKIAEKRVTRQSVRKSQN
ncbi:hypothetical protein F2Q70_00039428 [Brassica cretica]|uniref:DUF1985 domain-containing protein n=1 Tax=Brassica cretica TaxID=69181 RepID=A0A8S9K5Y5_BRACR|nr:hypothetical protein F2Q70_00039428 [Brassica cretica]